MKALVIVSTAVLVAALVSFAMGMMEAAWLAFPAFVGLVVGLHAPRDPPRQ